MFRHWGIALALLFAVNVSALDLVIGGCEIPALAENGADYVDHQRWDFEVTVNGNQHDFWLADCNAKITDIPDAEYSIRYRASGAVGVGPWLSLGTWTVENDRIVGSENPALGAQKRFWFDVNPQDYVEPWTVDGSLLAVGQGVDMDATYVASDYRLATDTSTTESVKTTRHSLNGSGSDRGVIAIIYTPRFAVRTLSAVTLDGVVATSIFSTGVSVDGGMAVSVAVAYWSDADEPGSSGTYDLVATWSGTVKSHAALLIEVRDADQATMLAGLDSDFATDQSPTYDISSTVSNQSGKLGITVLAQGDSSDPGDPSGSVNPTGTTLLIDKGYNNTTSDDGVLAVAYDADIASDSEAYQWTADSNVGTIDSIVTLSFAVNGASGGGPTTHEVSATENLAVDSAEGVQWAVEASGEDGFSASTVESAAQVCDVSRDESAQFADVDACELSMDLDVSESFVVSDTDSVEAIFAVDVVASIVVSDAVDVSALFEADSSESLSVSDIDGVLQVALGSIDESVAIATVQTGTVGAATINVSADEALVLASVEVAAQAADVSVVEAVDIASVEGVAQTIVAQVAESLAVNDLRSVALNIAASVVESLAASDSSTLVVSIEGSVVESVGLSSLESASADFSADAAFSLAINDAVLAQAIYESGLTEAVTITEVNTEAGVVFDITTPSGRACRVISQGRVVVVESGSRTVKL